MDLGTNGEPGALSGEGGLSLRMAGELGPLERGFLRRTDPGASIVPVTSQHALSAIVAGCIYHNLCVYRRWMADFGREQALFCRRYFVVALLPPPVRMSNVMFEQIEEQPSQMLVPERDWWAD